MASHPKNVMAELHDSFDLFTAHWNTEIEDPLSLAAGGVGAQQPVVASSASVGNTTRNIQSTATGGLEAMHAYQDHMNDLDGDYMAPDGAITPETTGCSSGSKSGVEQAFPIRLHYCIGEMEHDGLSHIVSWQPHGRCFVVHDHKAFVKSVLGK
jgi:hypothetical protein